MPPLFLLLLPVLLLVHPPFPQAAAAAAEDICIVGSGISGASTAFFLTNYTAPDPAPQLRVFERRDRVGGRLATVTVAGEVFEAGGSIIHPRNLHVRRFADLLGLAAKTGGDNDEDWLGIWDGARFVFKTLRPPPPGSSWLRRKLHGLANSLLLLRRYGLSLLRMDSFVQEMLQKFMLYYNGFESRPVFDNVEEMLKWSGLYGLTRRTLEDELIDAGLNTQTISELVTVITRINYGQSTSISGLAGAVSLAGSESGLWSIKGGNWQLAAGLLKTANASLHLQEGIESISDAGDYYVLKSNKGHEYNCTVTVVATPLDEVNITFIPPISIPPRKMQHTHTTFVRGLLDPKFFGLSSVSDIPELIGTMELPDIPFSCISVRKKHGEHDMTYKIFSRAKLEDALLDQMFSTREETIRIDWPAYPHYQAPEDFAPIILDGRHLYYVNTFESAASAMETGAVAAENVARLIISRLPLGLRAGLSAAAAPEPHIESFAGEEEGSQRVDL
ncbi:farnesylcysteine lyase [Aegilops tauschii subsp. strangulata]|uniref:Prenylcysteine lyase domain-containing protein n=5 Tax=Aegilops tauschii TaxID=37682 RepID=A0A453DJM3_AEGTS|nr:farnesylcysteine lyase [Aegilops tauschii subsp. strangulata]